MLDIPQQTPLDPFATAFNGSALDFNIQPYDIYLGYEKQEHSYEGVKDIIKTAYNKDCDDKKGIAKFNSDGEILDWWVVGKDYYHKTHREFFHPIWEQIVDNFDTNDVADVKINIKSARNGRWGLMDMVFPNIGVPITTTNGHKTTISLRIVAWSGLDGSAANNYILGAIDGFCTNGQIFTSAVDKDGAITKLSKRNSKLFDMKQFAFTLKNAAETFDNKSKEYQIMATKSLGLKDGSKFIDNIINLSDSKKKGLKELLQLELVTRGHNVFALHSALTNYSSHNDQLNMDGDVLFRTKKSKYEDMHHKKMFSREEEVLSIIESNQWQELLVAA